MADALLISDQYSENTTTLGADSSESAIETSFGSEIDAYRQQVEFSPSEESFRKKRAASGHPVLSITFSITEILEQLAVLQKRREHETQIQEEMKWIAENRSQFAGRWVALLGSVCLASGASAREVFDVSRGSDSLPLITYIDPEPLPFLGW